MAPHGIGIVATKGCQAAKCPDDRFQSSSGCLTKATATCAPRNEQCPVTTGSELHTTAKVQHVPPAALEIGNQNEIRTNPLGTSRTKIAGEYGFDMSAQLQRITRVSGCLSMRACWLYSGEMFNSAYSLNSACSLYQSRWR